MADFYMHRTLVSEFFSHIQSHQDYACLGSQGPDYFYYVLNKNDKAQAQKAGNVLHQQKTQLFLHHLLEEAIQQKSLVLYDYVLGFLTHHALDVSIHPYIFYYSGVYKEDDPKTYEYAGLHLQFERKVDISFIKHRFGFKPHLRRLSRKILPFKGMPDVVKKAVDQAIEKTYGLQATGILFEKGYATMRKVEHYLVTDRLCIKRPLLKYLTPYKTPRAIYYQDLSHCQNTQDFDYLNLSHQSWKHPVLGTEHRESVLEIYDQAKGLVNGWLEALKEAYDQEDASILSSLLPNASYETGLSLDKAQRMHYFKNYRKLLKK